MASELKPCPFCGAPAVLDPAIPCHSGTRVECSECDVRGGQFNSDANAIAAWNRRAPSPSPIVKLIDRIEEIADCSASDHDKIRFMLSAARKASASIPQPAKGEREGERP